MMKFKSLFRRGQQGKQEPTLKGAPSVSSLDSKHHKVAPSREKALKIFGSKEKLHKAHKKKDLGNNNALLEDPEFREGLEYEDGQVRGEYGSAEELGSQECVSLPVTLNADHMPGFQDVELRPRIPSECARLQASLEEGARGAEAEVEALRRQLAAADMERAQLQARLDDLLQGAAEADRLRAELERLKAAEAEREAAMERLADENGALRARLRGVAHSPLSDSEKRQLLLAPAPRRMHSSAPASIALAHNGEGDSGEASTPEWDKHSSSSLSEVSVACLQDRILQMEEHHYSTSEELQATLAELADLQSQLADAHADNERLADEKQVLLESLCRQTEKLEDSRTKVDTLQELLLREGVEPETLNSGDTDQQLFAVLKMSQEERRHLLSKQEQLEAELTELKNALEEKTKENETLAERIRSAETALERAESGRARWEQEANAARELAAARQHQLATMSDLLDAAKAKLAGAAEGAAAAEAAATVAARREADAAAARAPALAERLAHAQRQLDRAHDDARRLHDDALVSRNNAKSTISELEFQLEQLRQEKAALQGEVKTLQENASELQMQMQVASDEKLALMSRAGEALARAAELERQLQDARARLAQLERDRERDEAEWKQFQSDLLMTVRVANDFKTEAQRELERLVSENKAARDRIRLLEDQMHSLKATDKVKVNTPNNSISVLSGIDKRSESEQENYYEEIGQPMKSTIERGKNVADEEKISSQNIEVNDFPVISREEILKVPRKPKRPKKQDTESATIKSSNAAIMDKELANITKSVISLSRSPSAKDLVKKQNSSSVGDIVQSLEKKPLEVETLKTGEVQMRKHSLQDQQGQRTDTGSLPRQARTYHWKTLEHKRLSHPIRSLNDPPPPRPLPIPPRSEETPPPPLLSSASLQDIMATAASHRRTKGVSRQDSRLSVKSLIESIENAAKAAKQAPAATCDWPQGASGAGGGAAGAEGGTGTGGGGGGVGAGGGGAAAEGQGGGAHLAAKPPAPRAARPAQPPQAWRHEAAA
ncbi:unnamed protein product, partial [Iphiclides podalirius]